MSLSNAQIAQAGEDAAADLLKQKGYAIITRNYDLPMGEIDIVAQRRGKLRFIEVKASLDTYRDVFSPEERVDRRKRQRLQGLCELYCLREGIKPGTDWQIDIIGVTLDTEGKTQHIEHIENAVWDYRGV
ncbi:MAG: YraN family protein [Candidatus Sungbacteria bacterium]|uniref:UPF0102 protein HY220_02390 n=1 Tax=Candidatus Sungiibacteriota bacterium TaxID=2750080 RepID=A0A9D6LRP7_9BACT|nr:YraN family protein [Candidatus Sungbacteria bacterium]